MSTFRTPAGGLIDRSKRLSFSFDSKTYRGFQGDTLASALLANGVHLIARSFKYHRPRGILTAGSAEPNALVAVRRDKARYTPNLRATQVELYDGLQAESQNRWPSLAFDVGAANSLLARCIPAGFYYKTFMGPRSAWKTLYEPLIRARADERFVKRFPGAARPHKGFVVEAGRNEARKQAISSADVEGKARPAILALGLQPVIELDLRRAQVRCVTRLVAPHGNERI